MPNDLTLTAGVPHVVKTIGNKREPEKWSLYPERTILEIIMATKDSFVSIESAANTCFSSTPLSKRKVHNEIDDLSSTSKSRFSKIIKVEMNDGE
ncbi:hypothetical protein Bca4012_074127 [Brassica carinata]